VQLEREPDGFDGSSIDEMVDPDRVDVAKGSNVVGIDDQLGGHRGSLGGPNVVGPWPPLTLLDVELNSLASLQ